IVPKKSDRPVKQSYQSENFSNVINIQRSSYLDEVIEVAFDKIKLSSNLKEKFTDLFHMLSNQTLLAKSGSALERKRRHINPIFVVGITLILATIISLYFFNIYYSWTIEDYFSYRF